eukprot:1738825-Pleurochrysis_carterae.AAC.1
MRPLSAANAMPKDNSRGLVKILHKKSSLADSRGVTCLAEELAQLYKAPLLELLGGEQVVCSDRCCLDLAAVRGMRGVRGKGAALCGCQGKEGRQKVPGEDSIPAVGDGDDVATWLAALEVLRSHCSYGSPLMAYESLRSTAHVPPVDYDFSQPWHCTHCDRDVFSSCAEYDSAVQALNNLKAQADSGDEKAEKQYAKIMSEHFHAHLGQTLFVPPVIEAGSDIFIVDMLHCIQLNVTKSAWKYSFADKLDEARREQATGYMESIDCYLDLRAKGQRKPKHKFMSGSTVDNYVMGRTRNPKSKSPGLAVNTLAMCEIAYGGKQSSRSAATIDADGADSAAPAAAPAAARRPSAGGGSRRR